MSSDEQTLVALARLAGLTLDQARVEALLPQWEDYRRESARLQDLKLEEVEPDVIFIAGGE